MTQPLLRKLAPLAILVALLVTYAAINPFRGVHWLVLGLFVAMTVASPASRNLAATLVPAAIFGFSYDLMRLFAGRAFHTVITEPIYRVEQTLVGWVTPEPGDLGPVDFFRDHHALVFDMLGGLWYSTHVPAILIFGVYLWWRHWRDDGQSEWRLDPFLWGYLAFNVLGFVVWAVMPCAPPWYIEAHGFGAPGHPILGSAAGLNRVDTWLGYRYFAGIYEQETYMFGAMPSLHVAAPVWLALWTRKKWMRICAWTYAAMMCFFAVYLTHHYIVDIVAGGLLAASTYAAAVYTRLGAFPALAGNAIRSYLDELFALQPQGAAGE